MLAEKSYKAHIDYFGSPEAYAEAIKSRIRSGQSLSDPAAAIEFQKDYPQYFSSEEKLVPLRSTLESKGLDVTYSPDTGEVTVTHPDNPYAYKYTFKPSYVVEGPGGGVSYVPESKIQAIEQRVTPTYQRTYTELSGMADKLLSDLSNMASSYITTINNMVKQYGDAGLAMLKAYQEQYSQALAQMQQLMQPQKDVPESVKLAIQLLKEQTDENLKALDEEMIRRGIYRSGIAMDMAQKLRKGQLEEEQKLLAQWLDQQHQQMYNAALQYAKMQADYASNLANLYQAAYMKPLELGMQAAQTAYQLQAGLAEKAFDISKALRTWLTERQQAAQESALQYQRDVAKQQADWLKWLLGYQLDVEKAEETKRWHDLQYGLQSRSLASLEALRNAQIQRISAELNADAATQAAIANVLRGATTRQEALGNLQSQLNQIVQSGADVGKVILAINRLFGTGVGAEGDFEPIEGAGGVTYYVPKSPDESESGSGSPFLKLPALP